MSESAPKLYQVPLMALGLFLVAAVLYAPTLTHQFVNYDDDAYVYENAALAAGLTRESVYWAFTAFHSANWHPFTWISHAIDISVYGFNPAGHHLTNLLLHGLNGVLVFLFLYLATGSRNRSFFVALFFSIHPLHVESVAWIAERKDLLSVCFGLLTLMVYSHYARKPSVAAYLGALLLFAASLLSKPMLVTLPCVLLLLDLWPLERLGKSPRIWAWRLLEKTPFLILVGCSIVLTLAAQENAMTSLEARPLSFRLANAVLSYGIYLYQTVAPWPLAIPYPFQPEVLTATQVGLAALLLAFLTLVSLWQWRNGNAYGIVGWLWFLGTLVPVIGLLQVGEQAHADRYTYFPHIGLFVFAVWTGASGMKWLPVARVPIFSFAVIAIVLFLPLSFIRIGEWKDSETLFRKSIARTEGNFVAHNNLGKALMERGAFAEASEHFAKSVELSPTNLDAQNNMAVAFLAAGETHKAVETLAALVALQPDDPEIRVNHGAALFAAGYPERGRREAEAALKLQPGFSKAHQLIAVIDQFLAAQ